MDSNPDELDSDCHPLQALMNKCPAVVGSAWMAERKDDLQVCMLSTAAVAQCRDHPHSLVQHGMATQTFRARVAEDCLSKPHSFAIVKTSCLLHIQNLNRNIK